MYMHHFCDTNTYYLYSEQAYRVLFYSRYLTGKKSHHSRTLLYLQIVK